MSDHAHEPITLDPQERTSLGAFARRLVVIAAVAGLLGFAVAIGAVFIGGGGIKRLLFAYLANFSFFLSLSLGGLFFVLIKFLTRSGAAVSIRRVGELVAAGIAPLAILFIPILLGVGTLYHHWVHPEAGDELVAMKAPYLNVPFFIIRWIIYFAVWGGLAWMFLARSRRQDDNGDPQITASLQCRSAPGLLLYAITLTFASFDLLMSLDPHWFSTIFGVYYFTGAVVGFYSLLALLLCLMQHFGLLRSAVSADHYHDIGKMMFGFVVFWAYIAYSQYMLIWYGNIPEETMWYIAHGATTVPGEVNAWSSVLIVLLVGHFVLPFFGLVSKWPKRRAAILSAWAVWLLVMHWVDLWWVVMPIYAEAAGRHGELIFGLPEIGTLLGIGGWWLAGVAMLASDRPLIPLRDPRLSEALRFENV